MRYIIELPKAIHKRVIQLIAEGKYSTMQDFAITALQNQLMIEVTSQTDFEEDGQFYFDNGLNHGDQSNSWKLSNLSPEMITVVPYVNENSTDNWIFGQINRVLPMKFGVRVLLSLLQLSGEWIPLDWFLDKTSEEARKYGKMLLQKDEAHQRSRVDRFSIGFPVGQLSKSLKRYTSQFLGYLQPTTGRPLGALPSLNFASIIEIDNGQYSIGITEGGKKFGLFPNRIIDDGESEVSISEEEAEFYIMHVKERALGEANALRVILELILEKNNDTELIDVKLHKYFPRWSPSQRATNRSGAIGRATDLGLLKKVKQGQKVIYELTNLGRHSLVVLNEIQNRKEEEVEK